MSSEAIRRRIDALLSKTRENGATEEEEMAAMAKAMELISKYQVDMTKERAKKTGVVVDKLSFTIPLAQFAAFEISSCVKIAADVVCFRKGNSNFYLIGLPEDVQMAKWLLLNLTTFAVSAVNDWWSNPENYIPSSKITGGERTRLKQSFIKGFADRCEIRAAKEKKRVASSSTSLVVVKEDVIDEFMSQNNIAIKTIKDKKQYDAYAKASGFIKGSEARIRKTEEIKHDNERGEAEGSTERVC